MFLEIRLKFRRNSIETEYKTTNDYYLTIFDNDMTKHSIEIMAIKHT